MTDNQTLYSKALDSLHYRTEEIREAFDDRANQNGVIDADDIGPLLTDLSTLFSVDFSEAVDVISRNNANITNYFDLDAITFDAFMELIKIWLQQVVKNPQRTITQESAEQSQMLTNQHAVEQYYPQSDAQQGNKQPRNYRINRETLDQLMLKNRQKFTELFLQRQNQEAGGIFIHECWAFLQECFDSGVIQLKEKSSNQQDFFRSANSYNKFLSIGQGYFVYYRGADPNNFDVQQVILSYDECFDILDYWFQVDDEIILLNDNDGQNQTSTEGNLKSIMTETIAKYQNMIAESKSEADKQILQTTVETLTQKLKELETEEGKTTAGKSRREDSKSIARRREDRKIRSLRETFDFYAKQQVSGGKAPTFSKIHHQFNTINLGKFSVILKNFRIKIDQFRLKEMFKKMSHNSEDLTFDEFVKLLQKVSNEAELVTEVKVVQPNPEIRKDYRPDCYKKTLTIKTEARSGSKRRDESEKRRNDHESSRIDELWSHMGLYNGNFRKCLQTVQLAFNSAEKETFRIPPDSLTYKFREKFLDGKSPEEIKDEVDRRNELRRLVKDAKIVEKSLLKSYKDSPSKGNITTDRIPSTERREDSYALLRAQRSKIRSVPELKLTMKQVGKCKHGEMRQMGLNVAFDPFELINENDEEDNIYLAEYSLEADIAQRKQKEDKDLKIYEDQGKIKIQNQNQRRPLPGKYSYLDNSQNVRVGTGTGIGTKQTIVPPINPKPLSLADIDYKKTAKSTSGMTYPDLKAQMLIAQSVKHTALNPNIRNLENINYENPQLRTSTSGAAISRPGYPSVATPIGYNSIVTPARHSAATGMIGRMSQVQEEMKKKESQMINNIMTTQHQKIEKGLRVIRR